MNDPHGRGQIYRYRALGASHSASNRSSASSSVLTPTSWMPSTSSGTLRAGRMQRVERAVAERRSDGGRDPQVGRGLGDLQSSGHAHEDVVAEELQAHALLEHG